MRPTDRRSTLLDWPVLLAAGLYLAAPSAAHSTDLVFAQNFLAGTKQVVTYPVGDPGNMTVLGPLTDTLAGMDFDPGVSTLWAIDSTTHALGTVNQSTGAFAQTVGLLDPAINAFTIDPVGGTFYVSKGDDALYALDPASGETIQVGTAAPGDMFIRALAADCSGLVFALANDGTGGSDMLYRSHPDLSEHTLIGPTGYAGANSLEFDNRSGTLYAWFSASGDISSTHVTLDTTTGVASHQSLVSGRYRMAIRNECSIFMDDFEA